MQGTRGLAPLEHSRTLDIPGAMSTTATFMNLQPLVEYTFNVTITALINSNTRFGPPGAEVAVVTRSNEGKPSFINSKNTRNIEYVRSQ